MVKMVTMVIITINIVDIMIIIPIGKTTIKMIIVMTVAVILTGILVLVRRMLANITLWQ